MSKHVEETVPKPVAHTKATIDKKELVTLVGKYQERTFAEEIDMYEKIESKSINLN